VGATDRLQSESEFHDRQARDRRATFRLQPHKLWVDDDAYLNHESWIRPAFAQLGDVNGLCTLDLGCGHGMAAVVLARRGARVTALDLSSGYLVEAGMRARANAVAIDLVRADGLRLPFGDGSFERVWGNAVLHHLNLEAAAAELRRVLRPGGHAVFCEPWGENRLLGFARRRLPYPGKGRTPDERPICRDDLDPLRKSFSGVEVRGFQLLGMAGRLVGRNWLTGCLGRWDEAILARVPALARMCRYVVLTLRR
jgi:SAM-dependent methyltransferase